MRYTVYGDKAPFLTTDCIHEAIATARSIRRAGANRVIILDSDGDTVTY